MPSLPLPLALDQVLKSANVLAGLTVLDHLPASALAVELPWGTRVMVLHSLVLEAETELASRLWSRLSSAGWLEGVWDDPSDPEGRRHQEGLMRRLCRPIAPLEEPRLTFWKERVREGLDAVATPSDGRLDQLLSACLRHGAFDVADALVEGGHVQLHASTLQFVRTAEPSDAAWSWLLNHVDPSTSGHRGRPIWWLAAEGLSDRANEAAREWAQKHHPSDDRASGWLLCEGC